MLETILGLYLKSLFVTAVLVLVLLVLWFFRRVLKGTDKTFEEKQQFLYDVLMIYVMTVPILSFGIVGLLLIVQV